MTTTDDRSDPNSGDGVHDAPGDGVLLVAEDIEVRASWGHIFGPTSLRVAEGGVTVLVGSGGRGRTALLLTLAGRMKPSSGDLTAFGRTNDAHHLFARAAIADIDEVDGIEQAIRVHDVVTEQIRWRAPWYKWVRQSRQEDLERICRPVFGDLALPSMDAFVEELPELTASLFRIAVANVHRPPLLVVGGVDRLSRIDSTRILTERLVALGAEQTVITADVNGVHPGAGVREVIRVENLTDNEFAMLEQQERIL
ncbi:ATP-binding cassette domain-containing protein [Gordonia sp. LSe1-13]|uniref:ATP-binding cassette domain-containing protein n=1 Tax=Gordonia sesuvii TaxID=3116777 RepID=A0ABU7MDH9_9ACTN|nr:ATP-binding cassette domain-containing protein [Gordonia sp. LSe1-13]